jgi:hypothetical protein
MRGGRSGFEAVDAPYDTVTHVRDIEVKQITNFESAQAQIAQKLAAMDLQYVIDGLDLHDHKSADKQIDAICIINGEIAISKRN